MCILVCFGFFFLFLDLFLERIKDVPLTNAMPDYKGINPAKSAVLSPQFKAILVFAIRDFVIFEL